MSGKSDNNQKKQPKLNPGMYCRDNVLADQTDVILALFLAPQRVHSSEVHLNPPHSGQIQNWQQPIPDKELPQYNYHLHEQWEMKKGVLKAEHKTFRRYVEYMEGFSKRRAEIQHWWLVSPALYRLLQQKKQPLLEWHGQYWWGLCDGKAPKDQPVIQQIVNDINKKNKGNKNERK